jgi:hypothetical protein
MYTLALTIPYGSKSLGVFGDDAERGLEADVRRVTPQNCPPIGREFHRLQSIQKSVERVTPRLFTF